LLGLSTLDASLEAGVGPVAAPTGIGRGAWHVCGMDGRAAQTV